MLQYSHEPDRYLTSHNREQLLWKVLRELGDQGWELVAATDSRYWFKRPLG